MSRTNKIINGVIWVIAILFSVSVWHYYRMDDDSDAALIGNLQLGTTKLTKTIDAQGKEHAGYQALQVTLKQLKAMDDSTIRALKKETKYWKDLYSHTSAASTTTDTLTITVRDTVYKSPYDSSTVHAKTFHWKDDWLSLKGILSDSLWLTYSLKNNLTVDYYWKRDHWWKKPELQGSIVQANPNTTTDKVVQFVVAAPPKMWYETTVAHIIFGVAIGATGTYLITK
jgi:hypothetical protein